jgi:hypothetical protein
MGPEMSRQSHHRSIALHGGLLLLLITATIYRCSNLQLAGSVSETTNGSAVGKIVRRTGVPASQTQVKLYPAVYDPVKDTTDIPVDTTDALGNYAFTHIANGDYTVLAVHLYDRTRTFITGIYVADDTVTAPTDTLQVPGSIKVMPPDSADLSYGYLYVPGTNISTFLSNRNSPVVLDSVPAGTVPAVYYSARNTSMQRGIRYDIRVASGDTAVISNPAWSYAKRLFLTTTASGAGVSGNVINFPVLIRLTDRNFPFAQAKRNGEDIRFTKSDTTQLPYEIERWDSAAGAAEIWVKVDTVFGNDSTHFITLFWGNSNAQNASNSAAVFSTTDGNVGIWHLEPGLSDATANGNNGIDSATSDSAGIIGRCRWFDNANRSFITIPNESQFDIMTNITISAWILVDKFSYQWQAILTKGDNTYRLHCDTAQGVATFSLTTDTAVQFNYQDLPAKTRINDHQWHLINGVYDGSVMRIYTDGVLEGELTCTTPCLTNDRNLIIGENQGVSPRFFNGAIDEIRVLHSVETADWIKLCYMNQKTDDQLFFFK